MKKIIVLLAIVCLLLAGCNMGRVYSMKDLDFSSDQAAIEALTNFYFYKKDVLTEIKNELWKMDDLSYWNKSKGYDDINILTKEGEYGTWNIEDAPSNLRFNLDEYFNSLGQDDFSIVRLDHTRHSFKPGEDKEFTYVEFQIDNPTIQTSSYWCIVFSPEYSLLQSDKKDNQKFVGWDAKIEGDWYVFRSDYVV